MQASGYDALQKAWETVNSPGWKVEKETSHGDTVSSKVGPKGSKIYKLVVGFSFSLRRLSQDR